MVVKVVDASALSALLFGEPEAEAISGLLTAYNASYLWLARRPDAELVTIDRQLNTAAKKLAQ